MMETLLFWSVTLNLVLLAVIAMLLAVFFQVVEDCRRDARDRGESRGFLDYTGRNGCME